MNGGALVIGIILFVFGIIIPNVGITDVAHDTQCIISMMVFLAGCICLSMAGCRR